MQVAASFVVALIAPTGIFAGNEILALRHLNKQ
jgi:hypothetical protein